MRAVVSILGVAIIAMATLTLSGAAYAETATLTVTNVATSDNVDGAGEVQTGFDMGWPSIYDTPSYSDCSATVNYSDGEVLSSDTLDVGSDPSGTYTWLASLFPTTFDASGNPVYADGTTTPPSPTRIGVACSLHRTAYHWQWYRYTRWFSKRGSARQYASGDCRTFVYLSGTLTIDCRGASAGERVTYYVRHRGSFDRCNILWGYPTTPGARSVSCFDRTKRVAAVVFTVRPGGRFTVRTVSVRGHWVGRVRQSEDVYAQASGTWTP